MDSMEIGYSIDKLPNGREVKVMHLLFRDINNETFHLPMPEEVFVFVEGNLSFHFKKFKQWLKTDKLKPMKDRRVDLPSKEIDYFQ